MHEILEGASSLSHEVLSRLDLWQVHGHIPGLITFEGVSLFLITTKRDAHLASASH
jgi:hypothetical protein